MTSDSCHITSGCSGLPKFEAVDDGHGVGPDAGQVASPSATTIAVPARGSMEHHAGLESVVTAIPRSLGGSPGPARRRQRGVTTGADDRVQEELVVVLAIDPGRVTQHGTDRGRSPPVRGPPSDSSARRAARSPGLPSGRSQSGASSASEAAGTSARTGPSNPLPDAQAPGGASLVGLGHPSDHRRAHLPNARRSRVPAGSASGVTMPACVPGSRWSSPPKAPSPPRARGTAVTSTSMPTPPTRRRLAGRTRQAGPPRSWMPITRPSSNRARQASMRRFLLERVADLDTRAAWRRRPAASVPEKPGRGPAH